LGNGVFALILIGLIGININILCGFYIPILVDGDIITDLSNLEITADGDLVLRANLSSQTDINLTSHHGDITQSGDIDFASYVVIIIITLF
jgi:hypothetical protein